MKRKNNALIAQLQRHFGFLSAEYGFREIKRTSAGTETSLIFRSADVGVRITFDAREAYLFITLYRLIDGEIVEDHPWRFDAHTPLNGFLLDSLIQLRDPAAMMKPTYAYEAGSEYADPNIGFDRYLQRFASNLRTYADDILGGDFSVFTDLDRVVKQRAAEAGTSLRKWENKTGSK